MVIESKFNIGDDIFVVEDFNPYYDPDDPKVMYKGKSRFGRYFVIKKYCVEGLLVIDNKVFVAEDSHDGWNKMEIYHSLTRHTYGDCKIFGSYKEAKEFAKELENRTEGGVPDNIEKFLECLE